MKGTLFLLSLAALALAGCSPSSSTSSSDATAADRLAAGEKLYGSNCSACHMADGSGVENMQPALQDNAIVAGDPNLLIRVVLQGPAAVLPANRPAYSNTMPPFAHLSDQEIADILTYVRQQFGSNSSAIPPNQVAALRTH